LILLSAGTAKAQHGTAEAGYYPRGYHGDTWSGIVVSANEDTREITLEFKKGDKVQRFVGVPEKDYQVKAGQVRPLKMSDIPLGHTIKVWYIDDTKKVDGKKVTVNTIILIDAVANAKQGSTQFMGFN
jgi:hypothetical protein